MSKTISKLEKKEYRENASKEIVNSARYGCGLFARAKSVYGSETGSF